VQQSSVGFVDLSGMMQQQQDQQGRCSPSVAFLVAIQVAVLYCLQYCTACRTVLPAVLYCLQESHLHCLVDQLYCLGDLARP
jgi:hypothetical protein